MSKYRFDISTSPIRRLKHWLYGIWGVLAWYCLNENARYWLSEYYLHWLIPPIFIYWAWHHKSLVSDIPKVLHINHQGVCEDTRFQGKVWQLTDQSKVTSFALHCYMIDPTTNNSMAYWLLKNELSELDFRRLARIIKLRH